MGQNIARFLTSKGVKIVGIEEWDGCVYNRNGLDIKKLQDHFQKFGNVQHYVDYIDRDTILDRECDIMIICSNSSVIHGENAEFINCKMLVEAANGSTTAKGDEILNQRGILIVPDILGSCGGIISAYAEWIKNIQHKSLGRLTRKWEEKSKRLLLEVL